MIKYVYPEVIIESVNRILKKQNYNTLNKNNPNDRFEKAYNRKCILRFLTEKTRSRNITKEEINFESKDCGYKKIICEHACKIIANLQKEKLDELDAKYPEVKKFIKTICVSQ